MPTSRSLIAFACLALAAPPLCAEEKTPAPSEILEGLKAFYRKTARPDGSFQPGIDPAYRGMSDSAYSDLAAITYAVVLHKTFGWKLPYEEKTLELLLARQQPNGDFVNVAGTVSPKSPEGRTYNTTQGLVALHALGAKPKYDPLPTFETILKEDYKQLPAFSTSFFPLAYLCAGKAIPEKADRGIRALMVQDETGYANDHVAATFHASHYYRLVEEETPKAKEMVARILRDQKKDGSWLLHLPGRDRHATFDAVFTLLHEGKHRPEATGAAIAKAADWALSCRNPDGGFGHYPGSTSDADANYFQVGTLVMAGVLKPVDPLPAEPHLLSWGHLIPVVERRAKSPQLSLHVPGWVAGIAYNTAGDRLAVASADGAARIFDAGNGRELAKCAGHHDIVSAVSFHASGKILATGSYDRTAALWDAATGKRLHRLAGHRGPVLAVAFRDDGKVLATSGIDGVVKIWDAETGKLLHSLTGNKSWVHSLAFGPAKLDMLASAGSDGRVQTWSATTFEPRKTWTLTNAEVRSVALSPLGFFAAGIRYGDTKTWPANGSPSDDATIPGQGDMCAVAFSRDGKALAAAEGDWNRSGVVRLFRFDNAGKATPLLRLPHSGEITSIAFSRTHVAAGAADKTVRIWPLPKE